MAEALSIGLVLHMVIITIYGFHLMMVTEWLWPTMAAGRYLTMVVKAGHPIINMPRLSSTRLSRIISSPIESTEHSRITVPLVFIAERRAAELLREIGPLWPVARADTLPLTLKIQTSLLEVATADISISSMTLPTKATA